jgi:hypothetical protein
VCIDDATAFCTMLDTGKVVHIVTDGGGGAHPGPAGFGSSDQAECARAFLQVGYYEDLQETARNPALNLDGMMEQNHAVSCGTGKGLSEGDHYG